MQIQKILIEKEVLNDPITKRVLKKYAEKPVQIIDNIQKYFGKVKKPYLHKRNTLYLYIGENRGTLVKSAPPAYGLGENSQHYYFIHAYNCIYECEYCYLQSYFHSPDIVLYTNHIDIIQSMEKIIQTKTIDLKKSRGDQTIWFHAGEFSDSLAMYHLTRELKYYIPFLEKYPNVKIEFRTKSANAKYLLELNPPKNLIVSFSMSTSYNQKKYEHNTSSIATRLNTIKKLASRNFTIGLHFDPIIYYQNFEEDYYQLFHKIKSILPNQENIECISLGTVRFTKDLYRDVQKNYPDSNLTDANFTVGFDNKIRYNKPIRYHILRKLNAQLNDLLYPSEKIYWCME